MKDIHRINCKGQDCTAQILIVFNRDGFCRKCRRKARQAAARSEFRKRRAANQARQAERQAKQHERQSTN